MKSCVSIYIFLVMSIFHLTNTISEEENRIRKHFLAPEVETLPVSDWHNPSFEDYVLLENHIKQKVRDVIASPIENRCFQDSHLNNTLYGWITYRLYRLKFIDTKDNMPIRKTIYFNNDPQKKDRCVVCYAGYPMTGAEDRDYRRGITFIIDALNASHFDGHFIYQIGGWPNLQQGRLKYIDVPYAFKPFFLEEVRNLGYKQVLWIDTACIPVRNLDPIFNFIKQNGCCFFSDGTISEQMLTDRSYILKSMGLSKKKTPYMSLVTQVIGFDFENTRTLQLLDLWIKSAEKKVPFLEPSADQFSFCLLTNELNLLNGKLPNAYILEGKRGNFTSWKHNHQCIIYHHYDFLNPAYHVPSDLFG